jgi:hypothetical protein
MLIEEALELIDEFSVDYLKGLTQEDLILIIDGMTQEEVGRFFMEKNVKVFGGIDGYINDFLTKVNLVSMDEQGKAGARGMLNMMLVYPGISEEMKGRVRNALRSINYATAPAAGGKRKALTKRKAITRRKMKGLKRSRVRR